MERVIRIIEPTEEDIMMAGFHDCSVEYYVQHKRELNRGTLELVNRDLVDLNIKKVTYKDLFEQYREALKGFFLLISVIKEAVDGQFLLNKVKSRKRFLFNRWIVFWLIRRGLAGK